MEITQGNIRTYNQYAKKKWHDEEWHAFMNKKTSKAIEYAIETREYGDTLPDLQKKAQRYLEAVQDQ